MSLSIQYDSTFEGFLSAVFEIYRQHLEVGEIRSERSTAPADMFLQPFHIETSEESAARLHRAIVNFASEEVYNLLHAAFLSEEEGVEMKIFAFLKKLFSGADPSYGQNPASAEMLPLYKLGQSVRREAGGMLGLVRFAVGLDNMLCAEIEPKYDILMLMENHCSKRFANEKWLIYDSKRDYGLFHDRTGCQVVTLPGYKSGAMDLKDSFTDLWREFYKSIAIKERENPKLLRRCLPVRYWNHLPERSMATAVT